MANTEKATEARKANALARREQDAAAGKRNEAELSIVKKYGDFLPPNADPIAVYQLWKKSIFGEFFEDADDSIMYFVVAQAKLAGIDVRMARQIYAIPFNKKFKNADGQWDTKKEWTVITGIDALSGIAERTGGFGGFTKPEYEFGEKNTDPDNFGAIDYNKIVSCTIGVQKVVQGVVTTSYATAYFDEYDTGKNLWRPADAVKLKDVWQNGKKTGEQEEVPDGGKPKTMIAKVARAQALRAAFPACAGMYVAEEMERAEPIDGQIVTPDLENSIKEVSSQGEMRQLMDTLTVEDKKRAAPMIAERLRELKK